MASYRFGNYVLYFESYCTVNYGKFWLVLNYAFLIIFYQLLESQSQK